MFHAYSVWLLHYLRCVCCIHCTPTYSTFKPDSEFNYLTMCSRKGFWLAEHLDTAYIYVQSNCIVKSMLLQMKTNTWL